MFFADRPLGLIKYHLRQITAKNMHINYKYTIFKDFQGLTA